MKNILFSAVALLMVMLSACDKESSGTEFDLSEGIAPYIIIGKTAISTTPGGAPKVRFTMRTGLAQTVTVTYSISGAVTGANQTAVIDKYSTTKDVEIPIPGDAPSPSTATVTLVSAAKSDGTALTIGRYADPTGENVTINIEAP